MRCRSLVPGGPIRQPGFCVVVAAVVRVDGDERGCARPMRIAAQRSIIDNIVDQAQGEVGPDRYAAHSDVGWHRPAALAMLAQAYRAAAASNGTASASSVCGDRRIRSFPVRPPRAHVSGKGRAGSGPSVAIRIRRRDLMDRSTASAEGRVHGSGVGSSSTNAIEAAIRPSCGPTWATKRARDQSSTRSPSLR